MSTVVKIVLLLALCGFAVVAEDPQMGSFPSAMNNFDQAVKSFTDAFEQLASAFGRHAKSAVITRDACMGFGTFSEQTQVNVIECIPDAQVGDFVSNYFRDLAFAFGGDINKVKAELLAWKYAGATNFSYDGMQLTNADVSKVRMLKVFKNHDNTLLCSHWVIVDFTSHFTLAPDTVYWEKSSTSWGGFDTKDEEFVQRVPHKISINDVEALDILFDIIAYGNLARTRGIPFTFPELPNCTTTATTTAASALFVPTANKVVEAASVGEVMSALADRELNAPVPSDWQRLMKTPATAFFGNVNATALSTPASVERYVSTWPCAVRAGVVTALEALISGAAASDRYLGEALNVTVVEGHLATVLVVMHATNATGVRSVWSFGMNTTAALIQQTEQVPYRHCWHCNKCLWSHACCCETKEKTVPRAMTLREVEDVYTKMRAQQYQYWAKHRPRKQLF